jgi:hypothetical protein
MKTIKFKGEEYLFGGDSLDEDGFIAKREDYENGVCSYAHYFPDRGVLRFMQKIGERDDIEVIGDGEADVNFGEAITNMLTPGRGGWPRG